jgi:hypothetical protein
VLEGQGLAKDASSQAAAAKDGADEPSEEDMSVLQEATRSVRADAEGSVEPPPEAANM